jgi:allophanate hydrolase
VTDDGWTVGGLRRRLLAGEVTPTEVVAEAYRRLDALDDRAAVLAVLPEAEARARAAALTRRDVEDLPLAGIPFAVKDNIDVAGLPTSAACASFRYRPDASAEAVARLERAGATCVAKTNLDQFATGLAGTRSPFGTPRNPVDAGFVPGGSSSGSAALVAAGVVPFALGTDTAGSGRVPASFTGIVGLKPTVGRVPTTGVVPAVEELDCVSVLAPDVAGAWLATEITAGVEGGSPLPDPRALDVVVPTGDGLTSCDPGTLAAHHAAVELVAALGHRVVEVDIEALLAVGRLLYAPGPWLRARQRAFGAHLAAHPETADPTVAAIVGDAVDPTVDPTAVDAAARAALDDLRPAVRAVLAAGDLVLLPVTPTMPTVVSAIADPVGTSRMLGTFTNFVNLFGLAAASVPMGERAWGLPAGAMAVGPAGRDALLAAFGAELCATAGREGRVTSRLPVRTAPPPGHVDLAVVGAHLAGLPLNHQLTTNGATFVRATTTAADYRLIALADSLPPCSGPPRPGLIRVPEGHGGRIAVELWRLPVAGLGAFTTGVPAPLAIGTTRLADGSTVLGFVCEGIAAEGAVDLTRFGGWRAWLAEGAPR